MRYCSSEEMEYPVLSGQLLSEKNILAYFRCPLFPLNTCIFNINILFIYLFVYLLYEGDSTCGQRALYQLGLTGIPIYNVS